ncbi:MAG: hypothetical protein LBE32_00365 [Burkholderiales bacterium]|jgi:hypothetical protein|nr:hypothetical protein [Burkholderiales bacterium]
MKTKLFALIAAATLSTCSYAQMAGSEKVLRLPNQEPIDNGYTRDISARIEGVWIIAPNESEAGTVQATRFDLALESMNEDAGTYRFRSEASGDLYWCNVTMPTGSAIECHGAFNNVNFSGVADGFNRYTGWNGGRGARVPTVMVKVQ